MISTFTKCPFTNSRSVHKTIYMSLIPVDGGWTAWSSTYNHCSVTCGCGTRTRSGVRTCTNPSPQNGGRDCLGPATQSVTEVCNQNIQCSSSRTFHTYFYFKWLVSGYITYHLRLIRRSKTKSNLQRFVFYPSLTEYSWWTH